MNSNDKYPFGSLKFIKAYIITMRPYLLFVSGITGIAGISFGLEVTFSKFTLIFLASFLSYGFGQALTDCFQIDTDTLSSPYRPLTKSLVSKNQFLTVSALGLILCISIFTFYNSINILLGLAAGAGLATYTYFKKRWWGGPFYNAWIVSFLFLMSYLSIIPENRGDNYVILYLTVISVFFGYSNFVLSGYFKDICADSMTGYYTFPVKFGRKPAAFLSDIFAFIFILSGLLAVSNSNPLTSIYSFIVIVLFLLAGIFQLILAQIKLHKVKNDNNAYQAIELVVHGYILLLGSITLSQNPQWSLFLILFYFSFFIVMKLRPMTNQI